MRKSPLSAEGAAADQSAAGGRSEVRQATTIEQSTDLWSGTLQLLRRYPLISFFVMAYVISWTYVIVFLVLWPLPDTIVTDTPTLFGPVVAGFVMTTVMSGKTGVR